LKKARKGFIHFRPPIYKIAEGNLPIAAGNLPIAAGNPDTTVKNHEIY